MLILLIILMSRWGRAYKSLMLMISFTFVDGGIRKHISYDSPGGWLDERICSIISLSTIFIWDLIID
jgi:hypothetical protein